MVKLNKHQAGRSLIAMVAIIGLVGYTAYIALRIMPVYTEFFSVRATVESLAEEMKSQRIDKAKYMDFLRKRLDMNYIDMSALTPRRDGCEKTKPSVFTYHRGRENIDLTLSYEVRVPIIANIDALLNFDYATSVPVK